jgi:hypothetical protein
MPAIATATSVAARMCVFIVNISGGSCGHDGAAGRRRTSSGECLENVLGWELEERSLFPPSRLSLVGRKGVYLELSELGWLRLPNETP